MSSEKMTGSCLCGAVRVTAHVEKHIVDACHCSMCRNWGGGPLFAVECGNAVSFQGEESIAVFDSSDWAERGFCSRCGTHLFYRLKSGGETVLPAGLLQGSDQWSFEHQIFTDEKPDWYEFANRTENMTGAEVFAKFAGEQD